MEQQNHPAAQPGAPRRMTRAQWEARRRRRRLRLVRNWILFLSGCAVAVTLMTSGLLWLLPRAYALIEGPELSDTPAPRAAMPAAVAYVYDSTDPRLTLVNNNLPLAQEPAPTLSVADDATGQQLEAEAAAAYRRMAEAARADGVGLVLAAGHQDAAARQAAFDAHKQRYLAQGLAEAEAEARAATIVPRPDCSEQATGYAAEILSDDYATRDTGFAESRAYQWLSAHAAEYGFVLRWPEQSQLATGMVYQPWHWRYVGAQAAPALRAAALSLEEFLALEQARAQQV